METIGDNKTSADLLEAVNRGVRIIVSTIQKFPYIYKNVDKVPGRNYAVIVDEAQFLEPAQIDGLRWLVDMEDIPVLCFGLRTDFLTRFFPGSQRLMELADSLTEIKTVCACGSKATVNARIDASGRIVTSGGQILLGGNDSYVAMCHRCWKQKIRAQAGQLSVEGFFPTKEA